MTPQLQKKIDFAIKLLQSAGEMAKRGGQPLEIAYSGGKDSDVILELAKMSGVKYRAIYKNTTIDPPGTIKHVREKGVEILQPKMNFQQLIIKKGLPSRWRRFCCSVLKEYKVLDYAVIGVRRDESRSRSERYHEPEQCRAYSKKKKVRQYMPILDWTSDDVAEFISERGIKCHPLYYDEDGMFHVERRLGCMCCPLQSQRKRIESFKERPLMARYYIQGAKAWLAEHPDTLTARKFEGNAYDFFVSQVFCNGERDFRQKFGASPLFGDKIDCKQFLEQQFNITL